MSGKTMTLLGQTLTAGKDAYPNSKSRQNHKHNRQTRPKKKSLFRKKRIPQRTVREKPGKHYPGGRLEIWASTRHLRRGQDPHKALRVRDSAANTRTAQDSERGVSSPRMVFKKAASLSEFCGGGRNLAQKRRSPSRIGKKWSPSRRNSKKRGAVCPSGLKGGS